MTCKSPLLREVRVREWTDARMERAQPKSRLVVRALGPALAFEDPLENVIWICYPIGAGDYFGGQED